MVFSFGAHDFISHHYSTRYSLYPRPKAWDTATIGAKFERLYFHNWVLKRGTQESFLVYAIHGAHSPEERAGIKSAQKFWKFVVEILESIPVKK